MTQKDVTQQGKLNNLHFHQPPYNISMSKYKNIYERYFDDLLKENFFLVVPYIIVVFPLLGLIDAEVAKTTPYFYIFLRFLFVIPIIISYILLKKNMDKIPIICHIYSQFLLLGVGVCVVSYYLGGITSDYYFGLIIISFLQFTFMPLKANKGLFLDILYFIFFFVLNFIPFDHDTSLLFKQMTNYISFIFFKYISSRRSQDLIYGSMHRYSMDKDLNDNEEAAQVFGELCHLISNPLFISQTVVKNAIKMSKNLDPDIEAMLNKSLWAQDRISDVVKKMLEFNRQKKGVKSYREDLVNPEDNPEIPFKVSDQ